MAFKYLFDFIFFHGIKNLNYEIDIGDTTMDNSMPEEFVNLFSGLIESFIEKPLYKRNVIDKNPRLKIEYELFEVAVVGFCALSLQGIYLFML